MRFNTDIMGRKLFIEAFGLHHIFIETTGHEFFYSRDWRYEGRGGKDRHWCLARKTAVEEACSPEVAS